MCNKKGEGDMSKLIENETYKKLNLSKEKIDEISITPKIKDGKMLFDKNKESHQYIVEDD